MLRRPGSAVGCSKQRVVGADVLLKWSVHRLTVDRRTLSKGPLRQLLAALHLWPASPQCARDCMSDKFSRGGSAVYILYSSSCTYQAVNGDAM